MAFARTGVPVKQEGTFELPKKAELPKKEDTKKSK